MSADDLPEAARRSVARLLTRPQSEPAAFSPGAGDALHDPLWDRHWTPSAGSASADSLHSLRRWRAQSRDLVRSNGIAASAVNTNVNRAVGTGLAYSAQPHLGVLGWTQQQGEQWRARTQAEFSLWADSTECDIDNRLTFYDHQDLALRSMLESGDAFTLLPDGQPSATMPYRLRLQLIEADRVGNPRGQADTALVAGGIRRARDGETAAAHVYDAHPGSMMGAGDPYAGRWVDFVGASGRRRLLQHWKPLRPEQPRGIPYLAPVIGLFRNLALYSDNEIKAAVSAAALTFFIETEPDAPNPLGEDERDEAVQVRGASVVHLRGGEKVAAPVPGRPNPAFKDFVQAVIDQLGAGTYLGPEMLMKRYATSYTAARAAHLDAMKHLTDMRTRIVRTHCQPILETWMAEAVISGRIEAPGFFADPLLRWAYTRATWTGDSAGSLNPKDEVTSFIQAIDARLMTREQAEWQLMGTDWGETYGTKKAEHDRLTRDGMLPVPKAGAAAPPPPDPTQPAEGPDGDGQ